MEYRIELCDPWGRRMQTLDSVPLLEVVRRQPDGEDTVRGILPGSVAELGPNWRIRVLLEGRLVCDAALRRVEPHWGESRRLILDQYVHFHEVVEIAAAQPHTAHNRRTMQSYLNEGVRNIAHDLVNRAGGALHYTVQHTAYPDAALREQEKFDARSTPENELETGGISAGNWVAAPRLDATNANAKDGKTIAGLEVDGAPWPDVRLHLVWCEETELNDAAKARHPETATWTPAQYDASAYKLAADAAKDALQELLDNNGVSHIELNPHRGADGAFDARVNAEGRNVALAFGGGECFNAALLELGHAQPDIANPVLPPAPESAPKDFYSYTAPNTDSITVANTNIAAFDAQGGVLESLQALAYFSGGAVMHISPGGVLHLRDPESRARALFFHPERMGVSWGTRLDPVINRIQFYGNPLDGAVESSYANPESIAEYGESAADFPFFSLSQRADADRMLPHLLDDLAHPEVTGGIHFFSGESGIDIGDLLEVRGAPLRRTSRALPGEWGGQHTGRLAGLVREVRHHITGGRVQTFVTLTAPRRSVASPLHYLLRGQFTRRSIFAFRLDDPRAGLDSALQLD